MRAGSTLLLHILCSNPEFISSGERNAPYTSLEDIGKLEIASRITHRAPCRKVTYMVDQVNHDHLTPNPEVLINERVRYVFLVREPTATIQSILELTQRFYQPWSIERAVAYYEQRLETLALYADLLKQRAIALTYEDLTTETGKMLRLLEVFLNLKTPLTERYALQRFTGIRGDPSANIRSRRVIKITRQKRLEIAQGDLDRVFHTFERCLSAFESNRLR